MTILALLAALALLLLNAFFVATEFAIVKVRPTRIEALIAQNRAGAAAVQRMLANLDGYLSIIQLGISVASIGLGSLGEVALDSLLDLAGLELPEGIPDGAVAVAIVTILHVVLGELAPKSLAIARSEQVAMWAAYPMRIFYVIFFIPSWLLNSLSNLCLRVVGLPSAAHASAEGGVSEEEIRIILGQARSAGLLRANRADLLRKAMSLPQRPARHLMVPRNDVAFFDLNLPLEQNLERVMPAGHGRYPLCDRELDDVRGIMDVRAVLYALQKGEIEPSMTGLAYNQFAVTPHYFPESMTGERLLAEFRQHSIRMAIIVDEYGGASGIVTPADIVTVVMGDFDDDNETEVVQLPGGAYDVEGTTPLEDLKETLRIDIPSEEMRTVAGFLMQHLGRMPRIGDRVVHAGFAFDVLDVQGPRVKKVRIHRDDHSPTTAEGDLAVHPQNEPASTK